AFKGVDLIIHAGDIDKPAILEALKKIAPVTAVRGNMDRGQWADKLPGTEVVEVGQTILYVLHDSYALDLEPDAAGFSAVISGHTHKPALETKNGVLFLNPGSAVMPRFNTPPCVALLRIRNGSLEPKFIEL
ncbi:MAG: metallophosphoesterase family protein, partial [Deltaproteobacteria bacterium]|nr:metallophosphoesterase family protein [Deltaproteobacteria bacterium]